MAKNKKLSRRQENILRFVAKSIQEQRRPPTIREIGEAADISSTSVVTYNLKILTDRKLIERDQEVSRGIRLTDKARDFLGIVDSYAGQASEQLQKLVRVPMLGTIVAGEPIDVGNDTFATYDEEDMVELAASMLPEREPRLFALRVKGDSMIDAMVNEGDLVIMKPQQNARNGDMVAVWLKSDSSTTLKHFFHEGDRIRLQPANPTMQPIYADPAEVEVQGKVVMVMRPSP